jgi:DNA gyrase subunit B
MKSIILILQFLVVVRSWNPRMPSLTRLYAASTMSPSTSVNTEYDAGAITVLEGLEPVRKRPGMYIGSTGIKGLHHIVFEVVDNSVDEALAGHCSHIIVTLHKDGSVEVEDNGRGIPCSKHQTTGKSALETVLCVLHAGGKFGGDESGYKVSGGLHGVGISVVNALSSELSVQVVRDNKHHLMTFAKGIPQTELQIRDVGEGDMSRGTKVIFRPDPSIFKTTVNFEFDRLANRLDELAYLNAGLNITMIDRRSKFSRELVTVSTNPDDELTPRYLSYFRVNITRTIKYCNWCIHIVNLVK